MVIRLEDAAFDPVLVLVVVVPPVEVDPVVEPVVDPLVDPELPVVVVVVTVGLRGVKTRGAESPPCPRSAAPMVVDFVLFTAITITSIVTSGLGLSRS